MDIDAEDRVEVDGPHFVERLHLFDARVVDEHVEPAERFDGLRDQRLLVFAPGDVAAEGQDLEAGLPELGAGGLEVVDVDVGQHDGHAVAGETL